MKKLSDGTTQAAEQEDNLRPEYDEAVLRGLLTNATRGKYVERSRVGTNVVRLAPDVAAAFPTEEEVNEALRQLAASRSIAA